MAPLVRSGWSPIGQTPIVSHRTRSHRKVSAIAALSVSPKQRRRRLFFRLHRDRNIDAAAIVAFLHQLCCHYPGRFIVVWDRLCAHRGRKVAKFLASNPRVTTESFPPYAPELNPVEYVWGHLKYHSLANQVSQTVEELAANASRHSRQLQRDCALLKSFLQHSGLFLCRN